MKCNECFKELNDMTLYCDRCGAQLSEEKTPLTFDKILDNVLPISIESSLQPDHVEEIKTAYFLSNIRTDFRGFKKKYIDQYIDYVLLRTYYEKNKVLLTTRDFDKEKALHLLLALESKKLTSEAQMILLEEYAEDYENKIIPKSLTDQIIGVYCTNFNLKMLNPTRFFTKSLGTVLGGVIKVAIILGIVGAIAFFGLQYFAPSIDLLDIVNSFAYSYIILGGVLLILGTIISRKKREFYPLEDIVSHNQVFKKHIKNDMKKRIKTLKFRMKKESKKSGK